MNEFFEMLSKENEYCINFLDVSCSQLVPWHFHPEVEIIYIEKGSGTRFVGDHYETFKDGDICLVGSNLPHDWKRDSNFSGNNSEPTTHVKVVHFHDNIFKGSLAALPEMQGINKLLFDSQYGIKFSGTAKDYIEIQMKKFVKKTGIDKLLQLISILDYMSKTDEKELLASIGYTKIRKSADFDRFDKIYQYMLDNFRENVNLESVSAMIGMTSTSFCRYFKKHTNNSMHKVLNEIRVGHACRLLIEGKMKISSIGYESGFSNISNFNEQFKRIKGVTPRQYIKVRQTPS
jgi:AraC-like DNA-binding protein